MHTVTVTIEFCCSMYQFLTIPLTIQTQVGKMYVSFSMASAYKMATLPDFSQTDKLLKHQNKIAGSQSFHWLDILVTNYVYIRMTDN